MTTFHVIPNEAEKLLREAATLIDQVVDWSSTDEGPDFWHDVHAGLNHMADEAASYSGNGQQVTPSAPVLNNKQPSSPPPLHTLSPKVPSAPPAPTPTRNNFVPPPLDQLMKKTKQLNPQAVQQAPVAAKEEIVHILYNGTALCGQVVGSPTDWPEGHFRVGIDEAHKATCAMCAQHAAGMARRI